jgi:hypothetical protein
VPNVNDMVTATMKEPCILLRIANGSTTLVADVANPTAAASAQQTSKTPASALTATSGVTVWDCKCPAFLNRCQKLNAASKGDYLFFVTREASTWETTEHPQTDGESANWTHIARNGSSGRGSRHAYQQGTHDRGRIDSQWSALATNTNRTALGGPSHYTQLTLGDTLICSIPQPSNNANSSSQPASRDAPAPPPPTEQAGPSSRPPTPDRQSRTSITS